MTAFERQGGEINISKTKRDGKRVEVIDVLTAQDKREKMIKANQKEETLVLFVLVLAFLLVTISIINII